MEHKTCKICGHELLVKKTKRSAAQLKKPYYYTAYYYCPHCKKLYHDETFKVENAVTTSLFEKTSDAPLHQKDMKGEAYDAEMWTDGACVNNGKPTARAAWAFVSGETERRGLVEGKQTNNIAEALAIYHALKWAGENGYKTIKLHTDSQISLYNMKKQPEKIIANKEIFANIFAVIREYDLQISFIKVLGHSGDVQNDRVDRLANSLAASNR